MITLTDVLLALLRRPQMEQHCGGEGSVLLMAHVDTVCFDHTKVRQERDRVYCGGRADDYAGLAIVEYLRLSGLQFRFLLTDGEESGGWGAQEFMTQYEAGDHQWLNDIEVCIGLDRMGHGAGAVEYIRHYAGRIMASAGFCAWLHEQGELLGQPVINGQGTWSDIEIVSRGIPEAVNLSVGYYQPHSIDDWIELAQLANTMRFVAHILQRRQADETVFD